MVSDIGVEGLVYVFGAAGGVVGAATTFTETLCVWAGVVFGPAETCLFSNTMLVLPAATAWNVQTSVPGAPITDELDGAMNVLPFSVTTFASTCITLTPRRVS